MGRVVVPLGVWRTGVRSLVPPMTTTAASPNTTACPIVAQVSARGRAVLGRVELTVTVAAPLAPARFATGQAAAVAETRAFVVNQADHSPGQA